MRSVVQLRSLIQVLLGVFVLALFFALPTSMAAQDVASLTGVVTDASGAVISDAQVKVVDTKTNSAYSTKTNSLGAYLFPNLPPGPGNQLTFIKDGFETLVVPNLYLAVNTTHTQNAQLRVGQTTVTVEVKGEGSAVSLDTTDATVGNNFDMTMVHELPVQIRDNPSALLGYQPGVLSLTTGSQSGDDTGTMSRSGSVTGARTDQGNITLDGLDVNDFCCGFAFTVVGNAPVDSVQEFRGEVANPLSSEGRGSGAQIALVTKSGTNSFHGAAYEYYRTRGFEANNFFNNFATPVVPREALVRNQFGADFGGPIIKDKLFFFFNYEGRRDAHSLAQLATVPLQSFKAGNINYINDNPGCSAQSVGPGCVSTLPATGATSVKSLDPLGIGADRNLTSFLMSRYPTANSTARGDGLNTGGYQFLSPDNDSLNDYVARMDYNLNSNMKLFARGSLVRETTDYNNPTSIRFPGDPLTSIETDHTYAWVIGHTWTISNTKVNQFVYGETRAEFNFPYLYNPNGTTQYTTFDATGTGSAYLTAPYLEPASQGRTAPVPIYRDDFTYIRGTHTFQVGGNFKPIKLKSYLVTDFNTPTVGLGAGLTGLNAALRPANLATDSVSQNLYDSAYTFILGTIPLVDNSYNNNRQLQPLPQGTGHRRDYRFYETEAYVQDSWKARKDLTLTYGLRYQFYTVPYEVNGLEAVPNLDFNQVIQPRIANGAAGVSGLLSTPIVTYSLGGKANHGAPLYHPDWHDFQPRFAFAFNPSVTDGVLGKLVGDRKTVIRGGAAIIDDHTAVGALNFLQDQNTWILQNAASATFATGSTPSQDLAISPRFVATNVVPPGGIVPPAPITTPYSPSFIGGAPFGLASFSGLAFNYAIDPGLKTPYSETFTFGIQRELPGSFQLDVSYFGRFAHRLLAQADAYQTVNFLDKASGTYLSSQFAQLSLAVRNNQPIPDLPFFRNQVGAAIAANPIVPSLGVPSTCAGVGSLLGLVNSNCATLVAAIGGPLVFRGDLADTLQDLNGVLAAPGFPALINPNVGLAPQFGSGLYVTNKGFSNYNGMLATLHKKTSYGLQFDVNYTWSHSLDNISAAANNEGGNSTGAGGIMCDSLNIAVCYANSDFDVQQNITGDWVYTLPFGRGKAFGGTMPRWADEVVGGWSVTGLFNWRTGLAFQTVANAFPVSFANNVPAIFNGDTSAIQTNPHEEINAATGQPTIQLFKNQTAALNSFSGPLGLQVGTRNNLRGPHYSDFDIGLAKHFPVTEHMLMEFRADAFNVFNHTNFELPGVSGTADISSPSTFGVIGGTYPARVLQLALRLDF